MRALLLLTSILVASCAATPPPPATAPSTATATTPASRDVPTLTVSTIEGQPRAWSEVLSGRPTVLVFRIRKRTIGDHVVGHILDPRTGKPPAFEGSVTVLTRDAAMADALATALFVLGPDEGLALVRGIEGVDAMYATRRGLVGTLALR